MVSQAFVWLGTHVDNARANAFYERLGFTIIGERIFDVGGVQARDWVRLPPAVRLSARTPHGDVRLSPQ